MSNQETWQDVFARIPDIPVPKIIASEPLTEGKWLITSKKTIEYPDGSTRPWEAVSRPQDVISVLAQTREKILILIAEYRPLNAPYWNISLPAGLVDAGYTKESTCKKELREETGYKWDRVQFLIDTPPSPGMSNEIISQYFMSNVVVDPRGQKLEPSEIIEVLRVPMNELDSLMMTTVRFSNLFTVDAKIDQAVAYARRRGYL